MVHCYSHSQHRGFGRIRLIMDFVEKPVKVGIAGGHSQKHFIPVFLGIQADFSNGFLGYDGEIGFSHP
jgi:hypothetical protein